ncbi:hypothetical protein SK128_021261, partial [Halocaridina rubra]
VHHRYSPKGTYVNQKCHGIGSWSRRCLRFSDQYSLASDVVVLSQGPKGFPRGDIQSSISEGS